MKKRIFVLSLVLYLCLTLLPGAAMAVTEDDLLYQVPDTNITLVYKINDGEIYITGCSADVSGELEIPGQIDGKTVTQIGKETFKDCKKLTGVVIPNSVTVIGNGAFSGCTALTSVTVPNSVTVIGNGAFSGCTALTSVTVPNSVTVIGAAAFSGCARLASITIPDSVTEINFGTFFGCAGLTSVTIPASVTTIGAIAFSGCAGLNDITIPNSVTVIGNGAFSGCTALTSVTIPNSVTVIGIVAFSGCTGLTDIIIPNSVIEIQDGAFSGCTAFTSITIPSSVTSIGDKAFGYNKVSEKIYGFVISGSCNSTAETYATVNDLKFNVMHTYSGTDCSQAMECEVCGYVKVSGEHGWDAGKTITAPSCTEYWSAKYTCAVCGETRTEELPALGHDIKLGLIDEFIGIYLQNDKNGHKCHCTRCDYTVTMPHEFGDWVITKAATATAAGSRERSCTVCAYKETETIPATGGSGGGSFTPPPVIIPPQTDDSKNQPAIEDIYADVTPGAWYIDAVAFVTEKGLMNGTDDGSFAPDKNLTRAMLAQILYNSEDRPAVSGGSFADVESGAWYASAVAWAAQKGIVSGYGSGNFGPNDNITREQLAVMLWRYAGQPASGAALDKFDDIGDASGYALPALRWAVEKGIINGKGGGVLDPLGCATRAEVAQVLMSYFK